MKTFIYIFLFLNSKSWWGKNAVQVIKVSRASKSIALILVMSDQNTLPGNHNNSQRDKKRIHKRGDGPSTVSIIDK